MEFFEKLKKFMGFPGVQESPEFDNKDRYWGPPPSSHDESESPIQGGFSRNFNIFTDPLEMHKYFEQQMSEMLRNFGFNEFSDSFNHQFSFPQIEEIPHEDEAELPSGDLRGQFLKPGFEGPQMRNEEKKDQDIDGKLDIKDWGSIFKGENSVTPYHKEVVPRTHFFGQSVTSKTIRNPDGSIETHHTVRDNQGNEETTITRKIGDKEHSITKRRDKDGKEEIIENFVNLDEKDVKEFFPKQDRLPEPHRQIWPFFDRFFK
jgi:hypothetical protein